MELLGIVFLSVFLEGTLSYLVGDKPKYEASRPWIKYISLLAGVGLAIGYKIDIPTQLGLIATLPLLNYILSGIVIGRGSNYVNDIMTSFNKKNSAL